MKRHLLAATALTGFVFFAAAPAFADCDNNAPTSGQTVACAVAGGTDTTGVDGSGQASVVVNVDSGATVQPTAGGTDAILIGNGHVDVGANANVISTAAQAIHGNNNGAPTFVTVGSGALISGGDHGIQVDGAGNVQIDSATVIGNSGTAIETNFTGGGSNSLVSITSDSTITGDIKVDGGNADDEFHWVDVADGNFDTDRINGATASNIVGFEKFFKDGGNTVTLTGTTAANWTATNGTLIATVDNIGNADLSAGANLEFTTGGTYAGNITGAGNVIKNGGAFLTLSGDNTFTGSLTIENSTTLILTDANSAGTASVINIDQSTLTFGAGLNNEGFNPNLSIGVNDATLDTGANNVTLTGDISGGVGHDIIKAGGGDLILTGDGTAHTGAFIVTDGLLSGTTSNVVGDVMVDNGAFLAFNQSTNGTYAGIISGVGAFALFGGGNVTLTNTSSFTGTTDIFGGTLTVDGVLPSSGGIDVHSLATLAGTGTVAGAVTAETNATIAPGDNGIGTLHAGSVTFDGGSTLDVDYNASGASDRLALTGALTLGAGAHTIALNGATGVYGNDTHLQVATFGSTNATATNFTVTDNMPFLAVALTVTGTEMDIDLTRNSAEFASVAHNDNQVQEANAIQALDAGNPLFGAFVGLPASQTQGALNDLSGAHNAGLVGAMAGTAGMVRGIVDNHMSGLNHAGDTGDMAALAPAADDQETGMAAGDPYDHPIPGGSTMWLQAIGGLGHSQAQDSAPSQKRSSYGAIGGLDVPFLDSGYAGVFGGYDRGRIDTDSENASSDLDEYHAGAYVTHPVIAGVIARAGIAGTYQDIDTSRSVVVGALASSPQGDTSGNTVTGFAEISRPFSFKYAALEPFGDVSLTRSHINAYNETNGGAADLHVDDETIVNPATTLGLRVGRSLDAGAVPLELGGSLGWQHTYGAVDARDSMTFAGGTTSFEAYGPPIARDAAVVGASISAAIDGNTKAYVTYNGTLARETQDHDFTLGARWQF